MTRTTLPSPWLEAIATRLVPPACREHVLGDLAETSAGNRHYVRNLLSALPSLVGSQIRRRATIAGIIFNAFISIFAFLIPQGFPQAPFFAEAWAVPRLAVPWALWVIGSALAAAYGPARKPHDWNPSWLAGTFVVAVTTAWAIGVPFLPVALAMLIVIGFVLIVSMPWLQKTNPGPLSPTTLDAHARLFQRTIWWRNARESAACVLVISFNIGTLWTAGDPLTWTAALLLVAAPAFIMGYLYLWAGSRRVPAGLSPADIVEFHRRSLLHQRDVLRTVPLWYLLPFVPGMLLQLASKWESARAAGTFVALAVVAVIFFLVWKLNAFGARYLDGKLTELEHLEKGAC